MQSTTITLLRDSKSRFGFAIGADAMGIVVTKIAQTDALPQAGLIDERGRMNVGDIVTRVGEVQLVNERGLPLENVSLEGVRTMIKEASGESLTLEVRRPVAQPAMPPPSKPAATSAPPSTANSGARREAGAEFVRLLRDREGKWGLNVDSDVGGVFIKQLALPDATMADAAQRARLQVGQFLHSVNGISMDGVTREQARSIIKNLEGDAIELGVYTPGAGANTSQRPPAASSAAPHVRFAPEPPRAPRDAAPDGWSHSADGGFVRVDLNPPAAAPGGGDPFLAFAMRGTDVPPAQRRADLPPRHQALTTTRLPQGVDARVPPC